MSLGKTWFTPKDAASMFGIEESLVLEWVEEGLVRCERLDGEVAQVNLDDLKLEVEAFLKNN
ncbi:MAG: MerR family transcriptional regulator [Desulfuromonadales bacterium C00003094]|jgi:predicted site-specific integrase-resolvase|nr:MAG: MerR family transcriptional regulator [Desulfuromonadales bacterium C00003094]OEU77239.1 MAG: MerR family transcriptional regulator [Desulfuromonadales bacterium C00003107]